MFSPEQVKELLKNKNILRCSSKSITFSPNFKLQAVKQHSEQGYNAKLIFKKAGLDLVIIGLANAKGCLKRWRKIYNTKGEKSLITESRGRRGWKKYRIKIKSDKDKIKYLEAKVAYLDAENDFLAKLRGLKRE
jgi:transposase-like protein